MQGIDANQNSCSGLPGNLKPSIRAVKGRPTGYAIKRIPPGGYHDKQNMRRISLVGYRE
jgi:hypothetical protein